MSDVRVPVAGEVWRSKWDTASRVLWVGDGWVGFVCGGHRWEQTAAFVTDHLPPCEPWEHPTPRTCWAYVHADGSIDHLGDNEPQLAWAGFPAVVQCTVTPIDRTLRRVEP
jgi:hypothetical protein